MADWKESAKTSLNYRKTNHSATGMAVQSTPVATSKATRAENTTFGSWRENAKKSLASRNYVAPEKRQYELKTQDGKSLGTVSYGAYKAIQTDGLDRYTPVNDAEQTVLTAYKKTTNPKKYKIITDYVPGTNTMTKAEYNRKRSANPSLPAFGSYDYFKNLEESLRPQVEAIGQDSDRNDDFFVTLADNYKKNKQWTDNPGVLADSKKYHEKFAKQDALLAEYKEINDYLEQFETEGLHVDAFGEIDAKSGKNEADYKRARAAVIAGAMPLTLHEQAQVVSGDASPETQKKYQEAFGYSRTGNLEYKTAKAYDYYDKNKDNRYENSWGGRWAGNYKIGRIGIKTNDAGFSSFTNADDNLEAVQVYQALAKRIQTRNAATFQNNSAIENMWAVVAQYAPQGIDQTVYSTMGTILGAGMSGGNLKAGRMVGAAASAAYMYRQTAGASYVRMLQEQHMSVQDAKVLASSEALASGVVEFGLEATLGTLWSGYGKWKGLGKGAKKALSAAGDQLVTTLVKKGMTETGARLAVKVAKNAAKVAIDATGEGLEEWIQEGMSITADRYAKEGKTVSPFTLFINTFDFSKYSSDDFSRMNQSFLAGAIIGIGHGNVKAVTQYGTDKVVSKMVNAVQNTALGREAIRSGNLPLIEEAIAVVKENGDKKSISVAEKIETAIKSWKKPSARDVGATIKTAVRMIEEIDAKSKISSAVTSVSPYNKENADADFLDSVDKDMLTFIDKAALDKSDNKSIYIIGETTTKLNDEIQRLTGIDTALFQHYVKANSIRHILKDHGMGGVTDQSMANTEDIARMGYVIRNYDDIELLETKSKEYRDKNQQPAPMIKLSKKIDGTYYVVEAVPDTNAKKLAIVSAYIEKAPTQQTENVQALSSNARNASADVEAIDSISQNTDTVNSSVRKTEENNASEGEQKSPSVSVGEVYTDTKTGENLRIISRDENNTVVEIEGGFEKKQKPFTNKSADNIAANKRYKLAAKENVAEASSDTKSNTNAEVFENTDLSNTTGGGIIDTTDNRYTVAYTNDNQPIELMYKVVDVSELVTSNDYDGNINPAYPQELQPRDRSRVSSLFQIREIANNLNPARLAESTGVSEGAPIVGNDNVVESGNGRILAIKLAYETGKADAYRNYIVNNGAKYGIDPTVLPDHPVLVRERLTDVDRASFARTANEAAVSSLSATEQAKVDAGRLTEDILNLLVPNEEGVINTAANRNFISAVLNDVFQSADLNNMQTESGILSARGLERITNAIFFNAYGDVSLSARLSESLDNDMKNATRVLLNIAPRVVAVKNLIATGNAYDVDFSEDITSAFKVFEHCRETGVSVTSYASQMSLFEKEPSHVLAMAYVFESKNRGAKQATDFYNALLNKVISIGNPRQLTLGEPAEFLSKGNVFYAAVQEYNSSVERGRQIIVPEAIVGSERRHERYDGGYGSDEVFGHNTGTSPTLGNADGIRQVNGSETEGRTSSDDHSIRRESEDNEKGLKEKSSAEGNELSKRKAVTAAIQKSIKPEIASNAELMGMLEQKFGSSSMEELARKVISLLQETGELGAFEALFSDGGTEVYRAWEGDAAPSVQYSVDMNENHTSVSEGEFSFKTSSLKKSKKKTSTYNEFKTNAYQWAKSTKRQVGDITILNQNGEIFVLIEATDDGYIELKKGKYKEVRAEYERIHGEKDTSFYEDAQEIRSERNGNLWDLQHAGDRGNAARDGEQIGNQEFQSDTAGNDEYLRSSNKGKSVKEKSEITFSKEHESDSSIDAIESEDSDGKRNLLYHDGGKRSNGSRAGKQAETVAGGARRYREGTKARRERREYCQALRASGHTERRIVHGHSCEVIPQEHYTPRMKKIADGNAREGINETIFISGGAKLPFIKSQTGQHQTAKGIYIRENGRKTIIVQYDHELCMPEQINDHEIIHDQSKTPLVQKIKSIISKSLSPTEKQAVLERLAKDYNGVIEGNEAAIMEEFVANVMTDMDYAYFGVFDEIQKAFWAKDTAFVEHYNAREYLNVMDTGDAEFDMHRGNEGQQGLLDELSLPEDEYAMVSSAVMARNAGLSDEELKPVDFVYAADCFYIYKNHTLGDFTVVGRFEPTIDAEVINYIREMIDNGTYNDRQRFNRRSGSIRIERAGHSMRSEWIENARTKRQNDRLSYGEQRGDIVGHSFGSGENKEIKYDLTSSDADSDFWTTWLLKAAAYGTILKGEKPVRDVSVPKKISKKKVVSRFARTMLEAGVTPEENVSDFEKAILSGEMTHEVITNKNAKAWATRKIQYHGFKDAMEMWSALSSAGNVGKRELALGMELYNQCITNKDVPNAMRLAAELAAEATRAGQTLQATRMLKLMTPDGQLYYLEKSVQKMNDEFREKLNEKHKDIELDEKMMEDFFTETNPGKRDEIYDEICQDIADQIPATLLDKWNSWRYLAMLGNPRTHLRNIVGNAAFVPSVRLKTYIGAVIEITAGVDAVDRTKSLYKSKEAVRFAKKDFALMVKVLQGENAKYAITSDIEGKRTIFNTKWLEKLRTKNFEWLEKEDMWFLELHYVDALARLITIRKIDTASVDAQTLEALRAIAVKEAQAATYRDANALAEGLNKLQRKMERSDNKAIRATSVLVEGVMPFKKTPLNIAKQGVNYSPVGILKGVYKACKRLRGGEISVTEVIDDFSKGLAGTAVMLLGYFLASLGLLIGAEDKSQKEKAFDQMVGEQSYAIKGANGASYTIDWMAPSNLSLFIGAELYGLTKDDFSFADVVNATSTLTEPLLELSVFSGVNGVIESAKYSDSEAMIAIGSDMVTSYFTQALPTIGGQLSRIIDPNKREYYYVDKNSDIPKGLQRIIGKASSKIPFASYLFEPSVDEWGREETYGNAMERVLENTISPGYYAADSYTKVDKELRSLFERTGESAVLPTIQEKYYTENYVKYHMSAEDYIKVKKSRGQRSFELVSSLLNNQQAFKGQEKKYSAMTDEEKVKAIKKCYEQAGKETKEAMLDTVKRHTK